MTEKHFQKGNYIGDDPSSMDECPEGWRWKCEWKIDKLRAVDHDGMYCVDYDRVVVCAILLLL